MNEDLAARYLDGDVLTAGELAELGDDLAELEEFRRLIGDPTLWEEPSEDLEDRVISAIAEEASAGPPRALDGGDGHVGRDGDVGRGPAAGGSAAPPLPSNVIPIDRARRRTVRAALLSAAAAALIAAGITKGLTGGTTDPNSGGVQLALPDNRAGALRLKDTQSGLRIRLNAPDLPKLGAGEFYQGWLKSADGNRLVPIGTFHTGVDVTLWAGVPLADFPTLTVTLEPDDGDPKSSGNRKLVVDLTPAIGKT